MFGWRKRIGYIAPTVIEVVAYEFYRFAPDGIGLTGVTCSIDDWRPDGFDKGLAQVAAAATYLGSRGVDFIIHGGGPLVVARGRRLRGDHRPRHRGRRQGQGDHLHARRHGGAAPRRRAPHRDRLALSQAAQRCADRASDRQRLRRRPRRGDGSAVQGDAEPAARRHPDIRRQVLAAAPDCDALYLPCPQWQAAQIVEELEQATGKLVVAYTHACFFVAFRAMGLTDAIRGHGRLLASLAGSP